MNFETKKPKKQRGGRKYIMPEVTLPELPKTLSERIEPVRIELACPFDGSRIAGIKNAHESVIEYWFTKGTIDANQCAAANKFRHYKEAASGTGASAIDLTKPQIDYNYNPDKYDRWPASREDAHRRLTEVFNLLGRRAMERLEAVICHGHTLKTAAARCGYYSTEDIRSFSGIIRDYLNQLVKYWGMVSP